MDQKTIDRVINEDEFQSGIWNTITLDHPLVLSAPHSIYTIDLSPESKYIATAGGQDDYSIQIWDPLTRQQVGNGLIGHTDLIFKIKYSKCGNYLISVSCDNTVRQWNPKTQQLIGEVNHGHQDFVTEVQYTCDQKQIITCSIDRTIRICNQKTGNEYIDERIEHSKEIWCLSLSPVQRSFAFGDENGLIKVYNYERHKYSCQFLLRSFQGINSIQYSIDGNSIVSGDDDKNILLWDIKTKKLIRQFVGHTSYVLSVNFSPDMKSIISGGADKTVRLWNTMTGMQIGAPLTHHRDSVQSTQFSPDGKYIITGGLDKQLSVMVVPIQL